LTDREIGEQKPTSLCLLTPQNGQICAWK